MMKISFVTDTKHVDFEWIIGSAAPNKIFGATNKVKSIALDGVEFDFAMEMFDNLPVVKRSSNLTYTGDMAQFIYDNLPDSKAWNKLRLKKEASEWRR